ncbi:MAG: phage major tail protein, TP901-1 family [Rhizomicrobium sp.]
MSAQKGKDLLIKIGDGASPEAFTTVAGLRATTLAFNAQSVDVTNADSADQWRELLIGGGVKSATLSGSGVFKDAALRCGAAHRLLRPGLSRLPGRDPQLRHRHRPFKLTTLSYDGPYDGELKLSLSLASAGALTFASL